MPFGAGGHSGQALLARGEGASKAPGTAGAGWQRVWVLSAQNLHHGKPALTPGCPLVEAHSQCCSTRLRSPADLLEAEEGWW